jgi:hypothetical protein
MSSPFWNHTEKYMFAERVSHYAAPHQEEGVGYDQGKEATLINWGNK